jgi:protein-tyrosine-phosphatase/DNA-binding HxlR family transcriptional regulator
MTDRSTTSLLPVLQTLAHGLRWRIVTSLLRSDYRVQELVKTLEQPQNLVSYHLRLLREQGLVSERRSSADARDVYYSLNRDEIQRFYLALGQVLHPAFAVAPHLPVDSSSTKPSLRILVLCTENSARSQMAEGILRHLGGDSLQVYSAGTAPTTVHPEAVRAMAALSIDMSQQRAKSVDEFRDQPFDLVITVCDHAREECADYFANVEHVHWSIPDPAIATQGRNQARRTAFQFLLPPPQGVTT